METARIEAFWEGVSQDLPRVSKEVALANYYETVRNEGTTQGLEVLRRAKYVIKGKIDGLPNSEESVSFLLSLFEVGPWNIPVLKPIMTDFQRLNEWSNCLHYVFAEAIRKLGDFGAKSALRRVAAKHNGFYGYVYRPNGGNREPTIFLSDILAEVLKSD